MVCVTKYTLQNNHYNKSFFYLVFYQLEIWLLLCMNKVS